MQVFKNDFIEIFFDEVLTLFHVVHLRPMLNEEFYELLDIKIDLMKKIKVNYPIKKILCDARKIGPMCPEIIVYSNQHYDPQLISLNIEKFAFIEPDNIFANVNVKDYVNHQTDSSLQKRMFSDIEAAKKWLLEK